MYTLKSIVWLVQCCHVTVITENTAVLHIQHWNPRNRRQRHMLTYIMQFNRTICYIRGSSNTIPNLLSQLLQDSSPQERRENESKYMHEVDDFILPVSTRFQNCASLDIDGWTTTPHGPSVHHCSSRSRVHSLSGTIPSFFMHYKCRGVTEKHPL